MVNGFQFLTIFAKHSILDFWQDFEFASVATRTCGKSSMSDVWQGFEFAFVVINGFHENTKVRCLTGF